MENRLQYYIRVIRGASFGKLSKVLNNAHERSGKSKFFILLDMINCTLRYGSGYNDYVTVSYTHLDVYKRQTGKCALLPPTESGK